MSRPRWGVYAILAPALALALAPLAWMILTALKIRGYGTRMVFWPQMVETAGGERKFLYTMDNVANVLTDKSFNFALFAWNSLIVAGGCGVLTVALCSMAGYGFAKKNFPGRDRIFAGLIGVMLVPGLIFMVPQFAIVLKLGWMNSYTAMIVPHAANVFGLFLLRQHIRQLPDSLLEAAKVDGAGELLIFRVVVLPLAIPVLVTLFLLVFVGQWSNFLWQLIVNTPDKAGKITLPVGLQLFQGQYSVEWERMMAGACFSIVPIAVLFLVAQRYFVAGLTAGGVKE